MIQTFEAKQEIRHCIESRRRELSRDWVRSKSEVISQNLTELPEFRTAQCIHTYVAWRNEVDTHPLIKELLKAGCRVVVPVVDLTRHVLQHSEIKKFEDLQGGAFGILEPPPDKILPVELSEIDLIVVPGVAFDLTGNRIGFGGGYYDDFLKQVSALKVALAFQFQIVDRIPVRNQDQRVDAIVTEENVYRTGAGALGTSHRGEE
ncbi:MAG: 5-formyltetrahydrofolate cyclo-ligase [bacterium]